MLTNEEFDKLEKQYKEEVEKRQKKIVLESRIKNYKEIIEFFEGSSQCVKIENTTLCWDETRKYATYGKQELDHSERRYMNIDEPFILIGLIKEAIKKSEEEIKKLKGENQEEKPAEVVINLAELMAGDEVEKELDKLIEEIIYLQTDYNLNLSNILQHASDIKAIYLGGKKKC